MKENIEHHIGWKKEFTAQKKKLFSVQKKVKLESNEPTTAAHIKKLNSNIFHQFSEWIFIPI